MMDTIGNRTDSRQQFRRLLTWLCVAALVISGRVDGFSAEPPLEHVAVRIFGERILADNVAEIRRQAAGLPDAERFEFLAEWVLPGSSHPSFRLTGEFSQTRPAAVTGHLQPQDRSGGEIVSPVFDLLDLAAQTGRIEELKKRVAAIDVPQTGLQKSSRAALLIMLNLELLDVRTAEATLGTLYDAIAIDTPADMYDQWPETLVAWRCVKRYPDFEPVNDLLSILMTGRANRAIPAGAVEWFTHMSSLAREYQYRHDNQRRGESASNAAVDRQVRNWIPFSRERAYSNGKGFPWSSWKWDGSVCYHIGGHEDDYLYFRSPLRGDFCVEADLRGFNNAQILTAGTMFGTHTRADVVTGTFRSGGFAKPIDPPFHLTDEWIRYRCVIRNGECKTWLNGRLVDVRQLPSEYDPWVAVRSFSRSAGAVRDLTISGSPEVPAEVVISDPGCLSGWWGYHDEHFGEAPAAWQTPAGSPDGAQIIGRKLGFPGWANESLLRYHRPLFEDGSIDYEFYYVPGQSLAHPAFGRRAFLIAPDGVRQHWITDGMFDRSALAPDNSFPVANPQRESQPLPLRLGEWNSVRLALAGQTLSLLLNGERILERELEPTNSRHFGLFHYTEQSEIRVRNVVMRGDWPRTLPPVPEQQLADLATMPFDDALAEFSPVFDHDFGTDGLPQEHFEFAGGIGANVPRVTPQGVVHVQTSDGPHRASHLNSWLRMRGDFDVTADFADLDISAKQVCGCELYVTCEGGFGLGVKRRWQEPDLHRMVVDWAIPAEPGTATAEAGQLRYRHDFISTEALGGRFRVARRGDTVSVLFAEYDSNEFRLVASHTFANLNQQSAQVRLTNVANDAGSTRVTWKHLRIGANELLILPDPRNAQKPLLYVMNADGSELRPITTPMADSTIHGHASPDWSPNGDLIAFDGFTGRAESSHSYLIRPDGTGLKDLGIGIMPTFSPDGKRLAFTWSGKGMATMNLDGHDREFVTPEGWGAQWSPNGRWISYVTHSRVNGSYSANITIIDLESKAKRVLLKGDEATKYSQIYWNAAWSPDSRQIAFKGAVKGGESEVAVTSVDGSSNGFRVLTTETTEPDMAWHPDGKSLLLAMKSKEHSGNRLFVYNLATSELSLLESQPMQQTNYHGVWSPDGRRLSFSSIRVPEPIPWQPTTLAE